MLKPRIQGLLDLSHLIKKNRKGSYIHFKIKGKGNVIGELEKNEALDKKLLRYLTVKVKKFDLETNYFQKKKKRKKDNDRINYAKKDKAETKGKQSNFAKLVFSA